VTDYRLMIPGPVDTEDDVLSALAEPTLPHYGTRWMPIFNETTELLKQVFRTKNDVLMMPGPGTGAMEAAISSMVHPGHGIVVISNGHFGQRAFKVASSYDIHVECIEFPAGEVADPAQVRARLADLVRAAHRAGKPITSLIFSHHETSTGVLNPMQALAQTAHEFDLAVIVDAVSSLGGTDIRVDDWGVDACVSVPNKCLGGVPGVALMSVSERAWRMADTNPGKHGWYYDLRTWAYFREAWGDWHPFPTTLPTHVIVALQQALGDIMKVGLDVWITDHAEAARRVREGMAAMGFTLLGDPAYCSPTVSAFRARPDVPCGEIQAYLLNKHHIMISGGLEELKGHIIRVGHMGRARCEDYTTAFLNAVRAYLEDNNLPVYP
jgi:aspartate aminotransferase-like enzyme